MLADQVAGEESAEAAGAAGDQDGALGVDPRPRDREHDLADVAALAQVAEGGGGAAHVPAFDRRLAQLAGLDQADDLGEDLAQAVQPHLAEVVRAVGDAGMVGRDPLGVA